MSDRRTKYEFYKRKPQNIIWEAVPVPLKLNGSLLFSFDKKKIYSFWRDYPNALSVEEKQIFDAEFPAWVSFYEGVE